MADVDLVVGADVSGVERAAKQARDSLKRIGDGADKARDGVKGLGRDVKGIGEGARNTASVATVGFGKMAAGLAAVGIGLNTVTNAMRLGHKEAQDYSRAMANLTAEVERLNLAQNKGYEQAKLKRFLDDVEGATGADASRVAQMLARQMAAGVDPEQAKSRALTALDVEAKMGIGAEEFLLGVQGADAGFGRRLAQTMKSRFGVNTDGKTVDELVKMAATLSEQQAAKDYAAQGPAARADVWWKNLLEDATLGAQKSIAGKPSSMSLPDPFASLLGVPLAAGRLLNSRSAARQKSDWTKVYNSPERPMITASEETVGGGDPVKPLLPGQAPAAAAAISLKISAPQGTRATVAGATR